MKASGLLRRRTLVTGSVALSTMTALQRRTRAEQGSSSEAMTRPAVQKSDRYTWAPNLWTQPKALPPAANGYTHVYTCEVPDDFSAVRIGFLNMTKTGWTISKVIACASSSVNDYLIPTGGAAPVTMTFNAGGTDDEKIYNNGPGKISVAGNSADTSSGVADIAKVTWTDWVPLTSLPADPTTKMRVAMFRALVPGGQNVTFVNGTWRGYAGWNGGSIAINKGYDLFMGGLNNIDHVTAPFTDTNWRANYIANNPVNGTIFAILQFKTRNQGYTLVQVGESKFEGTTTTSQMWNWLMRSVGTLGSQHVGQVPIGYCDAAVGGYDSAHAFGLSRELLPALKASIVNVCGYNGNDNDMGLGYTDIASQKLQFTRTMAFVDLVRAQGGDPILVSPLPYTQSGASPRNGNTVPPFQTAFSEWKSMAAAGKFTTFDAYAVLGADEKAVSPNYLDHKFSNDGNHPNDAGHEQLVGPYLALIRPMLGLA